MNTKITHEHIERGAVVYVRQSSMGQVVDHTESRRRQYALVDVARAAGFATVETIDDDLGRSGSGLVDRPGFQRLVALVCARAVGAIYCIEASRLARNGRDWHHLIDLCALVGTLVIDLDGVYEPRMMNDRLLLGLKGTLSEYELALLRQRGLAARDAKARRGELQFGLPPGFCWNELGQIEIDPDERVSDVIRLVFRKLVELGSARQVLIWTRSHQVRVPVVRQRVGRSSIEWQLPAYHNILSILRNPLYAGAYAFGRTEVRTRVVDGRARKTTGHKKPLERWSVLLHGHHPGYITWEEFERNQTMLSENAHMQKRAARKASRGGRALLAGMLRCARCGRMLRVFYGSRSGHAHRYQCIGDDMRAEGRRCVGIGGIRVDRAVSGELLEVVAPQAVKAALEAAERVTQQAPDVVRTLERELEQAQYEAELARRRHEAVDPAKRLVARELETRWEAALQRVKEVGQRIADLKRRSAAEPKIQREELLALSRDLLSVWNAPSSDMRVKQRIVRVLIREVVVDLDDTEREAVLLIHWVGGRHTELRVARVRTGRYSDERKPSAVEVMQKLGGRWSDRELAVTMNRMRCKTEAGGTWTTQRVRELRERIGIQEFDPSTKRIKTVSVEEACRRLSICVSSVHRLIREGTLPASQAMPSAPWEIPAAALDGERVRIGVQKIVKLRPRNHAKYQDEKTLRLPGF